MRHDQPTTHPTPDPTTAQTIPSPTDRTASRRSRTIGAATGVVTAGLSLGLVIAPTTGSAVTGASAPGTGQSGLAGANVATFDVGDRAAAASRSARSADRAKAAALKKDTEEAELEVAGSRYATVGLNVRTKPDADAKLVTVLDRGAKVKITDVTEDGWRQVVHKGEGRWVKSQFLSKSKPKKAKRVGLSTAPCASGSGVESGLRGNTIAVHRAVCAQFPSVSSYGGIRGGSANHGSGRALDVMVSSGTGDQIAAYLRANASKLGISELIWEQRIWTAQRSSEGWRSMSDRGSATANHYDHVHVTVY